MKTFWVVVFAALSAGAGPLQKDAATRVNGVDDWAMGVALDGETLYCIAGMSLYALDVSEPLKPKVIGRLDGMDNRRQVAVSDGFAYVVSRETGLRIIDVHAPRNMKLRSRYDSVEFATGLDVVGKTVFLSERINGVEAVDVSDPDHPRHLCIRKTGESQSNRYRDGYLYSGEWGAGTVTVFDAHDMCAFRPIGKLELGGFGDGLEIAGNYLYCSTGHDARHHHAAEIKFGRGRRRSADPTEGKYREREQDGLTDPTKNDEAFLGAGRGLDIFDLSDPARPRHVSRVDFPVFKPRNEDYWTVRVADVRNGQDARCPSAGSRNGQDARCPSGGRLAFCCDSHNGFFVVDVKDPEHPRVVDRFCIPQPGKDWPSGAISSVAIGEGCVYVTSFPGGLWVIPVAGVHPPVYRKGAPPANATVAEAYPTDSNAFHVYRPATAGQARTACLRGDVVYAAFGDAGLHVVKLRDEGGFEKLGELPGNRRVTDCCFVGDRLVTAEGIDGWAVYEVETRGRRWSAAPAEGMVMFREVARRRPDARASVAFWCWPAGGEYVVLSPRNGPYGVFDVNDLAREKPFCVFHGTCQWDKYLPDGRIGDRLPTLKPYVGLVWVDFTAKGPKSGEREVQGAYPPGHQGNGVCRFGDRYLYTVGSQYQFVSPDGARTELRDLPFVPQWGGEHPTGIPRSDGRLVALTNRSNRRCVVCDFADPDHPKTLRAYILAGNPDLAAVWKGRAVIPAGHQGLLLER